MATHLVTQSFPPCTQVAQYHHSPLNYCPTSGSLRHGVKDTKSFIAVAVSGAQQQFELAVKPHVTFQPLLSSDSITHFTAYEHCAHALPPSHRPPLDFTAPPAPLAFVSPSPFGTIPTAQARPSIHHIDFSIHSEKKHYAAKRWYKDKERARRSEVQDCCRIEVDDMDVFAATQLHRLVCFAWGPYQAYGNDCAESAEVRQMLPDITVKAEAGTGEAAARLHHQSPPLKTPR
ncbi:hypothetical protein Slin14017_G126920 [Septoria linicola]|nr:hypothetical protein Slin14017_G126920 [Septoria linicola]